MMRWANSRKTLTRRKELCENKFQTQEQEGEQDGYSGDEDYSYVDPELQAAYFGQKQFFDENGDEFYDY